MQASMLFIREQRSKNFQRFSVSLLLFILGTVLHAAPLKTLSLDFTRELTENRKTEHTAGVLHYEAEEARVVVEVTKPLSQIMRVKGKELEIYYPMEKQAFRFISEGRIPLPFVESIIQSMQPEHGLTAIGYVLGKHDVVDEVLYTHWEPPEKAKDKFGPIILGMRDDRLISTEVKDPKGNIIARSRYQNHSKIRTNYIPMKVATMMYGAKSEVLRHELIIYNNPQVNAEPPNEMLNFMIPKSIEVKVIEW